MRSHGRLMPGYYLSDLTIGTNPAQLTVCQTESCTLSYSSVCLRLIQHSGNQTPIRSPDRSTPRPLNRPLDRPPARSPAAPPLVRLVARSVASSIHRIWLFRGLKFRSIIVRRCPHNFFNGLTTEHFHSLCSRLQAQNVSHGQDD